jgi:hypothetical protein
MRTMPAARRPLMVSAAGQVTVVDVLDKLTFGASREASPLTGTFTVQSDVDLVAPVFRGAMYRKLEGLLASGNMFYFRWFMFAAPHLLTTDTRHDGLGHGDEALSGFLARYGFADVHGTGEKVPFMPLFCAAAEGNQLIVRLLLEAGADPRQWDASGSVCPLHGCATYGEPLSCQLLLDAGADPDSPSSRLHLTPLHRAAAGGHNAVVRALLNAGAKVDPVRLDTMRTPAHMAALNGHSETLKMLIEAGANKSAKDKDGDMPIDLVRRRRAAEWGTVGITSQAEVPTSPAHNKAAGSRLSRTSLREPAGSERKAVVV